MKSIMLSIRPKWCVKIANGEKTIEVRKTRPKTDPPVKCYIYCTMGGEAIWTKNYERDGCLNGKVIGEFVCDRIDDIMISCADPNMSGIPFPGTGLTDREIMDYIGNGKTGYGWHISDLVIYDKPKELTEFIYPPCERKSDCGSCLMFDRDNFSCKRNNFMKLPPQSWCYVEEA